MHYCFKTQMIKSDSKLGRKLYLLMWRTYQYLENYMFLSSGNSILGMDIAILMALQSIDLIKSLSNFQ